MKKMDYEVICVDGNDAFIKAIKNKGFEGYLLDFEKENLPFKNETFDVVVCLEVI